MTNDQVRMTNEIPHLFRGSCLGTHCMEAPDDLTEVPSPPRSGEKVAAGRMRGLTVR